MSAEFTDDYDAMYEGVVAAPPVEKLPDGDYNAEIVAVVEKSWDDGAKYFEVKFKITDGECVNRFAWMSMNHGSEKQRQHTLAQVFALGFKKVSEFKLSMGQLVGVPVNINVWQNGKYTNVKINKRLGVAPAYAPAPAQQAALPGIPANNGSPF